MVFLYTILQNDIHGLTNYYHLVWADEASKVHGHIILFVVVVVVVSVSIWMYLKVPSFVMYFLDSGGGSYPELVYDDQIQWLKDTADSLHTKHQSLPAIAFFHIPT